MRLAVATWNVLHRIHAVNWSEPTIGPHLDEDARVAAIAARVAQLARERDVIALQEVSGDQLAAIRALVRDREIVVAPYPRIPGYHRAEQRADTPRDPTEYLVAIVPQGAVASSRAYAFPNDGGKGFLAVQLASGVLVVATHTSWGGKATSQLADLAGGVRAHGGPAVVLGDFNAAREVVIAALGDGFVAGVPAPGLATRPRADIGERSENIDHAIAFRGRIDDAVVESARGLSDHNIVRATFKPG